MSGTGQVVVSFILPCYNGAGYLADRLGVLRASLEKFGAPWTTAEIVLVDDGSTDATSAIAASTWPEMRVLTLPSNSGKGAAVRAGMLAARGDFRFFIDADVPFDLAVLPQMLDYLDRKEFDLVIGARGTENARAHTRLGLWRGVASRVFTTFVSRIVVTGVHDTQCGIKGFRAVAANYLFDLQETRRSRYLLNQVTKTNCRFPAISQTIGLSLREDYSIRPLRRQLQTVSSEVQKAWVLQAWNS